MNDKGDWAPVWKPSNEILGVPWDIPVVGYGAETVNFLRLWESRASNEFDLNAFNEGGYTQAVHEKAMSETVSKVLYPNDKTENGKYLRLVQQYFFVSCSLQDIIRRYLAEHKDWSEFTNKVVIQLNDTHPAIAIPELMRLLMDVYGLPWDESWSMCSKIFAYTNHTLLPEALEKWSINFIERLLPRHMQIIYEINARWMDEVNKLYPNDPHKRECLSIIEESNPKMVRMAYLAVVGSFSVNGVAALHTELLKDSVLRDFYEIFPDKFNNKTNGVTPRRWLKVCNPELSKLIDTKIGDKCWPKNLDYLRELEKYADDSAFQTKFMKVKLDNKKRLAEIIKSKCGIEVNPEALFDVQIKRLHEYKRQHLNLLHILTLYRALLHNPEMNIPPRVFIFGAKAAPGYDIAKNIIYAINKVGEKINNDKRINDKLKVVFIPNYSVVVGNEYNSRRRPVGTDFDRRKRGVGNGQYETRPKRRGHNRNTRRRKCGNQGVRRRRQHLHLRHDGRTSPATERQRLQPLGILRPQQESQRRSRLARFRLLYAEQSQRLYAAEKIGSRLGRQLYGLRRLSGLLRQAKGSRRGVHGQTALGKNGDFEYGAHRKVFLRPHYPRIRRRHLETLISDLKKQENRPQKAGFF